MPYNTTYNAHHCYIHTRVKNQTGNRRPWAGVNGHCEYVLVTSTSAGRRRRLSQLTSVYYYQPVCYSYTPATGIISIMSYWEACTSAYGGNCQLHWSYGRAFNVPIAGHHYISLGPSSNADPRNTLNYVTGKIQNIRK